MIKNSSRFTLSLCLALLLGVVLGSFLGSYSLLFSSLGKTLITLLKMVILPYILCAFLAQISKMKGPELKEIFLKGGSVFLLLMLLCYGTFYLLAYSFFSETTSIPSSLEKVSSLSLSATLSKSAFHSFVDNAIPITLLLAIFVGLGFIQTKNSLSWTNSLSSLARVLEIISSSILHLLPLAVFSLTVANVGQLQASSFSLMSPFLVLYLVGAAFIIFFLLPFILSIFSDIPYSSILKQASLPLLVALSSGSVFLALPFLMRNLSSLRRETTTSSNLAKRSVAIVPFASLLPIWNLFFLLLFLSYSLYLFHVRLSFLDHLKLFFASFPLSVTSLSSPSQAMNYLLQLFSIPSTHLPFFLELSALTKGVYASLATMGIFTLAFLTDIASRHRMLSPIREWQWRNALYVSIVGTVLLGFAVYYSPTDERHELSLGKLEVPSSSKEIQQIDKTPDNNELPIMERIRNRGYLKVGYHPQAAPFSYFNQEGHLAGFDIAFAQKLAESLKVSLAFVPLNYASLSEDLQEGLYDIAMSAVSVTPKRSANLLFSDPVLQVESTLLLRGKHADTIPNKQSLSRLQSIAVLKGTSLEEIANEIFTPEQIILVDDLEALINDPSIEAALCTRETGLAWVQKHSEFKTVKTSPSLGKEVYAYAVPQDAEDFAVFINEWLDMKKIDGFAREQFEKWILRIPKKRHISTSPLKAMYQKKSAKG